MSEPIELPQPVEDWLDAVFAGEKDDDADEIERDRNVATVVLYCLLYDPHDAEVNGEAREAVHRILGSALDGDSGGAA